MGLISIHIKSKKKYRLSSQVLISVKKKLHSLQIGMKEFSSMMSAIVKEIQNK